ncbi:MAG: hypothetical protein J0L62_11630 [Bacteroidetes bacterium]|nr:hypothetical protein [Bacteroidota bacterium]
MDNWHLLADNVNLAVLDFVENNKTKKDYKQRFEDFLVSKIGEDRYYLLNPASRNLIEKSDIRSSISRGNYNLPSPEIGEAYLLTVDQSNKGVILKIKQEKGNIDGATRIAEMDNFLFKLHQFLRGELKEKLWPNKQFFYYDFYQTKNSPEITTLLGNKISDGKNIYGRSLELPLFLSWISLLIGKSIPKNIAATGSLKIEGRQIGVKWVNGVDYKIDSLGYEIPGITRCFIPVDCPAPEKREGISVIPVSDVNEVLKEVFGQSLIEIIDYLISQQDYLGSIESVWVKIESEFGRKKPVNSLKYKFNDAPKYKVRDQYNPLLLNDITIDLPKPTPPSIVFDNFRPAWLVASLSMPLFNHGIIGTYNDVQKNITIIGSDDTDFEIGTTCKEI